MVTLKCEHCGLEFEVPFEAAQEGSCFCPDCGNFGKPLKENP